MPYISKRWIFRNQVYKMKSSAILEAKQVVKKEKVADFIDEVCKTVFTEKEADEVKMDCNEYWIEDRILIKP